MMLSLDCFVVTTSRTSIIPIKIYKKDTIEQLKKKIKASKDCDFDGQYEFTMWKINIPKEELQKKAESVSSYIPFHLSVEKQLDGKELKNSEAKIGEIFSKIDEECFHVVIQIQPVPNNKVYLFVDDSNLFIQGKYAVGESERLGFYSQRGRQLNELRIDHGWLRDLVLDGRPEGNKPVLVGSNPPSGKVLPLWESIKENKGYEVNALKRNAKNREDGVDHMLGHAIDSTVMSQLPGVLALVAGDGDYYRHVMLALKYNWNVEVWFWEKGTSKCLTSAFSGSNKVKYRKLDDHYKTFSYGKFWNGVPNSESLTLEGEAIKGWNSKDIYKCFEDLKIFVRLNWEDDDKVQLYFKKGTFNRARKWIEDNWGPVWETIEKKNRRGHRCELRH